jgi:uncharacterized membrane protein (DUF485 family)
MSVYEQAGKVQGPSVAVKVITAFLVPIVIFIVVLALSEKWLLTSFENEKMRTGVGVLLALGVDLIYILLFTKFKGVRASKPREN